MGRIIISSKEILAIELSLKTLVIYPIFLRIVVGVGFISVVISSVLFVGEIVSFGLEIVSSCIF
ncbi:TPA: hypothetical protein DIC40_08035 [Patescibacteria group bacterium]|nr:hypothetical protein [Candidatus Gracilibacteria bacterium]